MTRITRWMLFVFAIAALFATANGAQAAAGKLDIRISPTELAGAGTVNLEVTVSNTSNSSVTPTLMEDVFLIIGGGQNLSLGNIQAGQGRTDVYQVSITEDLLGQAVRVSLRWKENGVGETVDGSFTVKRKATTPKLALSRTVDKTVATEGTVVRITYSLQNQGDVDLSGVTLTDPLLSTPIASNIVLPVGTEAVRYSREYTMKNQSVTSAPVAQFIADGKAGEQKADPLKIELGVVKVDINASVKSVNADGTRIAIELVNSGNIDIKSAKITDELNALVKNTFELKAGGTLSVEHNVIAQTKRNVVFTLTGTDALGNVLQASSKAVSVTPYVDPKSVSLSIEAKLDDSAPRIAGKTAVAITLKNEGGVSLSDVVLSEATLGELETLPYLEAERTLTLQVDSVASNQWRFSVTANDNAGNSYSAQAETLSAPAAGTTPDAGGTSAGEQQPTPSVAPAPTPEAEPSATSSTLVTIMIIIVVLIILSVAALVLIRIQEKRQNAVNTGEQDELEALLNKPVRAPRQQRPQEALPRPPSAQDQDDIDLVFDEPRPPRPNKARDASAEEILFEKPLQKGGAQRRVMQTYDMPADDMLFEKRRIARPPYAEPKAPPAAAPLPNRAPAIERPPVIERPPIAERADPAPGRPIWQPPIRQNPPQTTRGFGPPSKAFAPKPDHRSEDVFEDIHDTQAYAPSRGETIYQAQGIMPEPTEEEEYERGRYDGMNNQPYNSGGDSPAYDRGYLQGCKDRSMR